MKKLFMVIPLVFLLCFTFSCQQGEEVAEEGLTEEEVNAIMADVLKVWNNADMEACDRVISADYVEHDPIRGDTIGLDAFKKLLTSYYENYSSMDLSIHETFIKNDKVAGLERQSCRTMDLESHTHQWSRNRYFCCYYITYC
jgi:hypothetical protein